MNEDIRHILRCPITKGALREMTTNEVKEVNSRIRRGELLHFDGTPVRSEVSSGFVSSAGQMAYPVEQGIFMLLQNLAIVLDGGRVDRSSKGCLRKEKKEVQDFYEQVGWQKVGEELFTDALRFEDLRPVSKDYIHKCHLRVNRYLKTTGKYILDVASGPIQYPEYLSYSSCFDIRICVDISFLALKEAMGKLRDRGIYLLADITNLPLKDGSVDAVVSLHTIYHVPEDEQATAFHEIYRVLKPGSSAVVVYCRGSDSFFMKLPSLPLLSFRTTLMIMRMLKASITRRLGKGKDRHFREFSKASEPKLYFHAHGYRYFTSQLRGVDFDVLVWRSVSVPFMKKYIHSYLLGKHSLALIYWLEDRFPSVIGRLGQYPMFVIKK